MPTPIQSQRPAAPRPGSSSNSNALNMALIVLLLASIGAGGYGWVKLNDRVTQLEKNRTQVAGPGGRGVTGLQPGGPTTFAGTTGPGATGGRNGRGAPRGGGAANTAARLGLELTDAQLTTLDNLISMRRQAQTDAYNNGEDPTAATAGIDSQIAGIVPPEYVTSFTGGGGPRGGGRNGRGAGGAGGPGGGGFPGGAGGAGGFPGGGGGFGGN